MTLYFEDLTVGDTYEVGSHTMTKEEIVSFAEQFDPQPFHVDEEAAEDSMFGELVASGLHTLCVSVRMFVDGFLQGDEIDVANMGGLGMDDLRWYEPVRPGDTLRVQIEVVDTRPSETRDDRGYVDFVRRVHTDEDVEVMSFISTGIVRRADAPA